MSKKMNNSNKKSTQRRPLNNLESQFLQQFMFKDQNKIKGPNFNEIRRPLQKKLAQRRNDIPPVQKQTKRSFTGASYNDGFNAVSPPDKRDERIECFDELIATVTGQTAFTVLSFAMNPGNSVTFPRLSKIAVLFEKYRFEQLEFYFQHDVSQFNAQGAAGLVLLSALYDAASPSPTNKTQIEATKPRVICMPNENSLLRCAKQRMHPQNYPLYVRPGIVPGAADIKTYDVGNMFLTVQGMAGAGEVGELHVRGRVMLMDEILDSSLLAAPINNSVSLFTGVSAPGGATTVNFQLPLATAVTNPLGIVNTAGSMVLPAGNYLIDVTSVNSASADATDFTAGSLSIFLSGVLITGAVSAFSSAAGTNVAPLFVTWFFASNGVAPISFQNNMTWTAGTNTINSSMVRITAI